MKSIFTRPLFINPQAYLTIPELSYIQMATPFDFTEDSYSFVINTSGRIEGKLLKTSNDYILHLDLYSIDGNCVLGEFYLNNSELNTDNFNLTQSKNIITLQFGEQSSGNITYPGLIAAWSAKGKTNDDEDRATLKDLTGNGHDITLNMFTFSEMSGYGGYNWSFNTFFRNTWEHTDSKIILDYNNKPSNYANVFEDGYTPSNKMKGTQIKVSGIKNGSYFNLYNQLNLADGQNSLSNAVLIKSDGIYSIPDIIMPDESNAVFSYYGFKNIRIKEGDIITIELIPEYPDALVFDGVDDYGVNENVPILTDFTVIAKRKTFKGETSEQKSPFISKMFMMGTGAFAIEGAWAYNNVINFGANNIINYIDNDITFVTKNNYNEQSIISGSFVDSQGICIGVIRPSHTVRWKGAIYSVYLFDRSLDEQEIKAFIRKYIDPEYLLPSEIPTPDCYYDLSQGSNDDENRETIKDYSGNGNDAVAHNFAWNEEGSGYKDGTLYFDGVDDYVSLDAFDSGFKTVFMVCIPLALNGIFYDQRKEPNNMYAFGSSAGQTKEIAYNRANNTKQYINGILNTTIGIKDLLNKKQLIHNIEVLANEENSQSPKLAGSLLSSIPAKICIYKFLGFKEALTEEQIQAVIKKYNLLDGVDEIEVS